MHVRSIGIHLTVTPFIQWISSDELPIRIFYLSRLFRRFYRSFCRPPVLQWRLSFYRLQPDTADFYRLPRAPAFIDYQPAPAVLISQQLRTLRLFVRATWSACLTVELWRIMFAGYNQRPDHQMACNLEHSRFLVTTSLEPAVTRLCCQVATWKHHEAARWWITSDVAKTPKRSLKLLAQVSSWKF